MELEGNTNPHKRYYTLDLNRKSKIIIAVAVITLLIVIDFFSVSRSIMKQILSIKEEIKNYRNMKLSMCKN